MEKIIESVISKLMALREDLILDIRNLNSNDATYSIKKTDLQVEVDKIDFKVNDYLMRLETYLYNISQK